MKNTITRSLLAPVLLAASVCVPMPVAEAATSMDWAKAQSAVRSAIECRSVLNHTAAVRAVFRAANNTFDGNYTFPEPLLVFGALKASDVWIFEGGDDVGGSYTVQLNGMKLTDVVKAAGLQKESHSQRFFRQVKGGHLEANELQPGVVQLACIRDGNNV